MCQRQLKYIANDFGDDEMKKVEFRQLAEDVSNCHVCERLLTLPHLKNSERLENDDHGLNTVHPYVNRWNIWQGDLDADIMLIGQDYGQKEDGPALEVCSFADTTNPTDKRLKDLFKFSFGWDIDTDNAPLFFTNMANCYRKNRTSGGIHSAWLPICANKFMERLIRIVQPKIIIVLGRIAFESLHSMEGLMVNCVDPLEKGKDSFSEMIKHSYRIDLDGTTIGVFPVFHPGSNSQINRTFDEQVTDWKRIAEYYYKLK